MPQTLDWKRLLETGMEFTEMRRSRARQIAADLVSQGQLAKDQVSATVDEIMDASRERSDKFRGAVRAEVQRQLGALGLATKADIAALERKLTNRSAATSKRTVKKTAAKKTAKRSPAKKRATTTAAQNTAAKKTTAKKTTAKKSAGASARSARRSTKSTAKKAT